MDIGREDGRYMEYGQELGAFLDLCERTPELFNLLVSKILPSEDRKRILGQVLERTGMSEIVKNFLRVLLEKERIKFLKEIHSYYQKLCDELQGIVRAKVITAISLKKPAIEKLNNALNELTGKKVLMDLQEDPRLIGGVVVKIGDLVIDGSIKAQLEGLKESLKRGEYH